MDLLDYVKSIDKSLKGIDKSLKNIVKLLDDEPESKVIPITLPSTDVWVVEPYSTCLTSMPPKYVSRICHYHDPNYIDVDCIKRMGHSYIFYTKQEAIEYCEVSLGTEYEIIDCTVPETIIIGDDYE